VRKKKKKCRATGRAMIMSQKSGKKRGECGGQEGKARREHVKRMKSAEPRRRKMDSLYQGVFRTRHKEKNILKLAGGRKTAGEGDGLLSCRVLGDKIPEKRVLQKRVLQERAPPASKRKRVAR